MRFWLTVAAIFLLLILAVRRGGQPERWVASTFALVFLVGLAVDVFRQPTEYQTLDPAYFAIDSATLASFIFVALRANRGWPLCAAALQLIVIVGHLTKLAQIEGLAQVYWGMTTLPQYLQLALLLAGIYAHTKRFELLGPYPDWRHN